MTKFESIKLEDDSTIESKLIKELQDKSLDKCDSQRQ